MRFSRAKKQSQDIIEITSYRHSEEDSPTFSYNDMNGNEDLRIKSKRNEEMPQGFTAEFMEALSNTAVERMITSMYENV